MRTIAVAFVEYDLLLGGILFLSTVIKWFALKARIEENGWKNMNPCDALTLLIYCIPIFGPMSFLALMTTLDEGAATSRDDAGSVIRVAVGPMRFVFADEGRKKKGDAFDGTSGVRRVRSFEEIASRRRRRSKLARRGEESDHDF